MKFKPLLSTFCTLLLAACGGGGGGSDGAAQSAGSSGGTVATTPPTCVTPATGTAGTNLTPAGNGGLQVTTTGGIIEGFLENGARAFEGVRFAAPPTGCLRFRPPQEPVVVQGVTPAQAMPNRCAQIFNGTFLGDEDCLFLNVWAPNDNAVHPVTVWLHGGNINGINGSKLAAATGTVVVMPNRRVSIVGTMALQQLIDESADRSTGTYAVLDTIAALRWVQRNIAAFGGDPTHVMLNGGSAGGSIACSLFAAPAAKGLFHAAAVVSGLCRPRMVVDASLARYSTFPPLKTVHAALYAATSCDTAGNKLDCLRNLSALTLLNAAVALPALQNGAPAVPQVPVVDGVVVTSDPYSALEAKVSGGFPLIAGSNRDEVRSLISLQTMDDAAYRAFLSNNYGAGLTDSLYALYPPAQYPSPTDAAYMLLSDLIFGCQAEALVRAAGGNSHVHLFEFTRPTAATGYAAHGAEFSYQFDLLQEAGVTIDQTAIDLKSAMQSAWAGLAATPENAPLVNAGSRGTFVWPVYDARNVQILELGDPVKLSNVYRGGRCATLDTLLPP
jgi:para-nitrobenzyl esterase